MWRYLLLGFTIFLVLVVNGSPITQNPDPTLTLAATPPGTRTPSESPTASATATRSPTPALTQTPTATATRTRKPTATPNSNLHPFPHPEWVDRSPTQTPTPTSTPTPTPAVMLAVGDIAQCVPGGTLTPVENTPAPGNPAYLTGNAVATEAAAGGHIFTLGDNSNDFGSAWDYASCFDPMWGQVKNSPNFHPAMGNHDKNVNSSGAPYFDYFGTQAAPENGGKYSLDLGAWHIIILNTLANIGGGYATPGIGQLAWLINDLNTHPAKCTLAIWHEPIFSSGQWGPKLYTQNFWQVLQDAGADVVLNGHNHNYERFMVQNLQGTPNPPDGMGMQEFVVGTGGADLGRRWVLTPTPVTEAYKDVNDYGYLKLVLWTDHYQAEFIDAATGQVLDQDEGICH